MRRKSKSHQSRAKKKAGRGFIKNRIGIEERPAIVDKKSRIGNWVIGKGHSAIVERLTSYTVSTRINDKSAKTVTAALEAPVYFANPYCSWQRGLNENTNGLLRQYWPKSANFKNISLEEVDKVISQLNNRPRKKLKFKTLAYNEKTHRLYWRPNKLCISVLNLPYKNWLLLPS